MIEPLNLRFAAHRERLAAELPLIGDVRYSIARQDFLAALDAVGTYLPDTISLELRGGAAVIHHTHASLLSLVELGLSLRSLATSPNFPQLLNGFSNPTQFWDTYFEARAASFFKSRPGIVSLSFAPEVEVKGRRKYPEFVVASSQSELFVECKRIRFDGSKVAKKFRADAEQIEQCRNRVSWPNDYCLEVEFIGAEKEMFSELAKKVIDRALTAASRGGEKFEVGNLRATVRHRDCPSELRQAPGLLFGILVSPGYPVSLADTRYAPFRAFRGDLDHKYLKLFRAAIADARTQLPADRNAAICISGVPLRVIESLIAPLMTDLDLAEHIKLVTLWSDPNVFLYASRDGRPVAEEFVGPIEWDPTA